MTRTLILAACLALPLGGCLTSRIAKMTPEQQIGLINAAAAAGCSGTLDVRAGAGTSAGLSPGYASGSFAFTGGCDPAKAVVVPLKDLGKPGTGTEPQT